jgi:hypothetical protein
MTIVSPGMTKPIRIEVSSRMPKPASSVRTTGSTSCTVSSTQLSTPLSAPANQSIAAPMAANTSPSQPRSTLES